MIFILETQPLGFFLRGAFIVAVETGLFLFCLEFIDLALHCLQIGRHGVQSNTQLRGSFVHQVDGLVWQTPVCNVAIG